MCGAGVSVRRSARAASEDFDEAGVTIFVFTPDISVDACGWYINE